MVMTNRELLQKLEHHFILLRRLAESPGPIRCNGATIKKWRAIVEECEAARAAINQYLEQAK
jgi:hypothetical protein